MGRVSAKRKLKQCDPFFKGKRDNGKKDKAFDLPPTESKRSKKRRRKMLSDEAMEQYVMRTSAMDGDAAAPSKKKQKLQIGSIKDGESMRDFNKRISTEVKRVIYDAAKQGRRSSEKRKAYLTKKKEKAREKKMTEQERYERDYQSTGNTKKDYFEDAAPVRFGDRVDAPPIMPKLSGIFKKRAEQLEREKRKAEKKNSLAAGARVIKRAKK
ncbi:hypothetical protein F441_07487 [Phytophthora nicotianae CJ01A1]|uniref:Uncharacterized protein n=6 Tax=Phytophthora nicotianae TaxID=4792 RepID=V9FBI0_PHYNI|nr:hypothetical protein F443_07500 [Phytophthora nicotianae P1569]ETK88395.1 hypothetical protein L915_07331 [Phytophthora nicotianae]ETO77241.1 hypothetical protein F444_07520 [Phytophthora nicotianae P1976]ETP18249.1 hypothetical protein F441_07487 [Phytophthora nicotianae CJ01A1]ETP46187.1 hypothetical protein F442_07516 [Phytophthora nicotianae P10297]KUF82280.1 hypothetical protein AM587_10007570 [Phytophthora nicotianae]